MSWVSMVTIFIQIRGCVTSGISLCSSQSPPSSFIPLQVHPLKFFTPSLFFVSSLPSFSSTLLLSQPILPLTLFSLCPPSSLPACFPPFHPTCLRGLPILPHPLSYLLHHGQTYNFRATMEWQVGMTWSQPNFDSNPSSIHYT